MTPKEKARHLIESFNLIVLDTALGGSNSRVKQCALISVNECINAVQSDWGFMQRRIEYWQEVKQEIEKL